MMVRLHRKNRPILAGFMTLLGMIGISAVALGQQGGFQEHTHSASSATNLQNTRKTPLPQQQLAEAIVRNALSRLWEQADAHFHLGEFNHTINLNRVIVQGQPQKLEAYENAAFLLWSTDRVNDGIAFLEQGLKANPKHYGMYDELGWYYYNNLKQPAKAIPYYENAVKYKAPFFTWHNLARCYERVDQWDKAVKTWEMAAKFPAQTPGATRNVPAERALARARAELAKRQNSKP